MSNKKLFLALLFFTVFGGHYVHSAVTSYENTFVAGDIHSANFVSKLNRNFSQSLTGGINNIETANIKDDTLTEADFADEINPRIRFYEQGGSGSECEMVYTGLIPATDSDLTSDISSGTAYVRGYRVNKSSATSKTYTADKWTYVDLSLTGDFYYTEVAIGAAAPSIYTNSIRLARVSTDASTINTVSDMRTTSCTTAKFSTTKEVTTEASLQNMLQYGTPVRKTYPGGTTPQGFAQGLFVSYDTHTQFKVLAGSAYIDGSYRYLAADTTVTSATDDPTNGVSGIVSGAPAVSTTYKVYAVADQDATGTLSISYGTSAAGLTTYREIGQIKTDATGLFTSSDVYTAHALMPDEIQAVKGWINFNGSGTIAINDSFNVSGISDGGTGIYTVTWDSDFDTAYYSVVCMATNDSGESPGFCGLSTSTGAPTAGAVTVRVANDAAGYTDSTTTCVMAIGD